MCTCADIMFRSLECFSCQHCWYDGKCIHSEIMLLMLPGSRSWRKWWTRKAWLMKRWVICCNTASCLLPLSEPLAYEWKCASHRTLFLKLCLCVQKRMRRSQHARKETEFLRLKRTRLGLEDFESLKVIGRGAFGEVKKTFSTNSTITMTRSSVNTSFPNKDDSSSWWQTHWTERICKVSQERTHFITYDSVVCPESSRISKQDAVG